MKEEDEDILRNAEARVPVLYCSSKANVDLHPRCRQMLLAAPTTRSLVGHGRVWASAVKMYTMLSYTRGTWRRMLWPAGSPEMKRCVQAHRRSEASGTI